MTRKTMHHADELALELVSGPILDEARIPGWEWVESVEVADLRAGVAWRQQDRMTPAQERKEHRLALHGRPPTKRRTPPVYPAIKCDVCGRTFTPKASRSMRCGRKKCYREGRRRVYAKVRAKQETR